MNETGTPVRTGQLVAGLVVLTVGILLLVDRLGPWEIYGWTRLWPLIVIAVGLSRFVGEDDAGRRGSGAFLVLLGVWFLINTFEIFGLDWDESWPLLLILIGLGRFAFPRGGRARGRGVFLILLGLWFQLTVLGVWGLDWDESWPLLIVFAGIFIVWQAFEAARRPRSEEGTPHEEN